MAKRIRKELIFELIVFFLCILSISLFWRQNILVLILLALLYLIGNWFWHGKHDRIFYITGFVLGPAAEIIAVRFGAWIYPNAPPSFLGYQSGCLLPGD